MTDNFEESTITLTDEEGKETVFEVIGTLRSSKSNTSH